MKLSAQEIEKRSIAFRLAVQRAQEARAVAGEVRSRCLAYERSGQSFTTAIAQSVSANRVPFGGDNSATSLALDEVKQIMRDLDAPITMRITARLEIYAAEQDRIAASLNAELAAMIGEHWNEFEEPTK